jgi:uncharacterized membrane protein YgcG
MLDQQGRDPLLAALRLCAVQDVLAVASTCKGAPEILARAAAHRLPLPPRRPAPPALAPPPHGRPRPRRKALRDATRDDLFWRDLARAKWGDRVVELRPAAAAAAASPAAGVDPEAAPGGDAGGSGGGSAGGGADAGGSSGEAGGWRAFTVRRMNLRPPLKRSPLDLGQERYPDPWQHVICCVLCR